MLDTAQTRDLDTAEPDQYTRCSRMAGWIVVHSYPRAERWARDNLHRRSFETYLPLLANHRGHDTPAFPGYLFVRYPGQWTAIRYCPGVYRIISAAGQPNVCPDAVVQGVRHALEAAEAHAASAPLWRPGDGCSLASGPLRGMSGVVLAVRSHTVRIGLMMLGHLRHVSVPIDSLMARED